MCFTDQLTAESVRETWDRVKVICTQPYKKDTQFGLAFIRIGAQTTVAEPSSPEASGPTMAKVKFIQCVKRRPFTRF